MAKAIWCDCNVFQLIQFTLEMAEGATGRLMMVGHGRARMEELLSHRFVLADGMLLGVPWLPGPRKWG